MDKMTLYLDALMQRRQVYYDYARLDYGTNVLSHSRLYRELGDEIDTIIHELSGFVKVVKGEGLGVDDGD